MFSGEPGGGHGGLGPRLHWALLTGREELPLLVDLLDVSWAHASGWDGWGGTVCLHFLLLMLLVGGSWRGGYLSLGR